MAFQCGDKHSAIPFPVLKGTKSTGYATNTWTLNDEVDGTMHWGYNDSSQAVSISQDQHQTSNHVHWHVPLASP